MGDGLTVMVVLVTGAGGMLGTAVVAALQDHDVIGVGRSELEVRKPARLFALVEERAPDLVINCAAHTDADAAERDPDLAYAPNAILPGLLGAACRRRGIPLIHFSSTGCYGDWKDSPYTEEDEVHPTTVHHRSKVSGENAVRESGCESLILRTGWLFGGSPSQAKNFVWKRLLEAAGTDRLASDTSQRGNPTYVEDVARQCVALVELGLRGTFNCVGHGSATRFEYVSRIVELSGFNCRVEPRGAFARAAPVSPNETAINYRLSLLGLDLMPEWTASLERYIACLTKSSDLAAARSP